MISKSLTYNSILKPNLENNIPMNRRITYEMLNAFAKLLFIYLDIHIKDIKSPIPTTYPIHSLVIYIGYTPVVSTSSNICIIPKTRENILFTSPTMADITPNRLGILNGDFATELLYIIEQNRISNTHSVTTIAAYTKVVILEFHHS